MRNGVVTLWAKFSGECAKWARRWSSYIYPRSSHLYYGPMLEREAVKRNLDWFTRWIKPAS